MRKNRRIGYIVLAVVAIIAIFIISVYNNLVKKEEQVKKQWNEVQATYQRRLDLVPSLVNVVKGQTNFEQTTLLKITAARSKAASVNITGDISADKYNLQSQMQDELALATNRLLINLEAFPELKGTDAFAGLQSQLEGTERRIKFARKDFNQAIAEYNSAVRNFPTNMVAGLFGFKSKNGFQADSGADQSVEIKFNK